MHPKEIQPAEQVFYQGFYPQNKSQAVQRHTQKR